MVVSSAVGTGVRRALLPFVAVALVARGVASIGGAPDVGVAVWSVASGVLVVHLVLVTGPQRLCVGAGAQGGEPGNVGAVDDLDMREVVPSS